MCSYIKIKNFCSLRELVKRIFSKHKSNNGLVTKTYKEPLKSNNNKANNQILNGGKTTVTETSQKVNK
jgi:collagenase-like PrtC family protease